jgi:hypothetical protein
MARRNARTPEFVLKFHPLRLPSFWGAIGLVCTLDLFFSTSFFYRIIFRELYPGLAFTLLNRIHRPSFYSYFAWFFLLIQS